MALNDKGFVWESQTDLVRPRVCFAMIEGGTKKTKSIT